MPFDRPLVVELGPSRLVSAWIGGLALAAEAAVAASGLSAVLRLSVGLAAALGFLYELQRHRRGWTGVRIAHDGQGRWGCWRNGAWRHARLAAPPVRLPGALLLELQPEAGGRRIRWFLARDMMPAEAFRRLWVRARLDARRLQGAGPVEERETDAPGDRTQVPRSQ